MYDGEAFIDLLAPRDDNMVPIARETLQGRLMVSLYDKKRNAMLFSGNCSAAGIEFSGDYKSLYTNSKQ
jgi:hypothetical protein